MEGERRVAGLLCSEVLADLSNYVDGALSADRAGQIEEHLRGCNVCEQFGQELSTMLRVIRERLAGAPLDAGVEERLRRRLRSERGAD
ncbi:MAG TPA: zf-HC2 domain-containing protein [Thermoanaerobaculia bacterium]|nr:zf-HC2 domain-containing protein [Thermoanaerobaculia bacterium]